ncbi:pentapeptide repeat-containing protein [Streptomyces sp. NPDC052020]|uniref:pentapeptide repeat-containing protein n=1 Tax=Streptomyces sp. NPDC052020 TaxID=3155677 RepID=UPI003412BE84
MTHPSPVPSPAPPAWPHCGHGATAEDPVGCCGIHVPGHTACLAHLNDADRDAYLAGLAPGSDIDHRGTPFTEPLLQALLHAFHDPAIGKPHLGTAKFDRAQFSGTAAFSGARFSSDARFFDVRFSGTANFTGAQFSRDAWFNRAQFSGIAEFNRAQFFRDAQFGEVQFAEAWFTGAQFSGLAWFAGARFSDFARFDETQFSSDVLFVAVQFTDYVRFHEAQFSSEASFIETQFSSSAGFGGARFSSDASFTRAQFSSAANFTGARFSGDAQFIETRFSGTASLGPVVCAKKVDLSGAVFQVPVTLDIAASQVHCGRTRWESTATLRLRYAVVDLSHAVLSFPVAVTAHPAPFMTVDESLLAGTDSEVRVTSVRGVDAMYLVLTDIDLTDCLFSEAFHLDQLRLEGHCIFAAAPTGLHFRRAIWPYQWTRRRTLVEEHHWRAQTAGQPAPAAGQALSTRLWRTGPDHLDPGLTPGPEDVATLYRQLRKAFEDGKNEPGAADFYYGEMEMRRHDRTGTPPGERFLLWGYWLLSGYGLRASRALGWLAVAMLVTIVLLMSLGLPEDSPKQEATGTVPPDGGKVTFEISKADPKNPTGDRFTGKRFEKALNVTLNSVVFRSSGQDLTTTGTYIEMASRVTEPVLLGLAVLALRNRVKR